MHDVNYLELCHTKGEETKIFNNGIFFNVIMGAMAKGNATKINLISTNIRFDNPKDGNHDWAGRRPVLLKVLSQFSPSIITSQEGREPQLRSLEKGIKLKLIDSHREWIPERMYPCIFIDENIWESLESGDIWLSRTPLVPGSKDFDSAFPRLATWAKLKLKTSKKEFHLINTHLDHVLSETRIQQIKVLEEFIKKIETPIIITGDFNESPSEKVYSFLTSDLNFKDPFSELGHLEQTSFHKFTGVNEDGFRIDWILYKGEINFHSLNLDKTADNDIWPSDHFPIKGSFYL